MLRVTAQQDERIPMVVPDGIFGPVTQEAVRAFQKTANLPPTGDVDQATWEKLVVVFDQANVEQQRAQPLMPILNAGQVLKSGTDNLHTCLVQAILHVLSQVYGQSAGGGHDGPHGRAHHDGGAPVPDGQRIAGDRSGG